MKKTLILSVNKDDNKLSLLSVKSRKLFGLNKLISPPYQIPFQAVTRSTSIRVFPKFSTCIKSVSSIDSHSVISSISETHV